MDKPREKKMRHSELEGGKEEERETTGKQP